MKIELVNEYESAILTYSSKTIFDFIDIFNFNKLLNEEHEILVKSNLILKTKFNILEDDGSKIGEVCINISTTNFEKEELYDIWYDSDYSMGIIAVNIIKENIYYKFRSFYRIAVITSFKIYDSQNRHKGYGTKAFKLIEDILIKIFKIECLYLYSYPMDLNYELKLYQDYIEYPDNKEIRNYFYELDKSTRMKVKKEYISNVKNIDNFYKKMNMDKISINSNIFYKVF